MSYHGLWLAGVLPRVLGCAGGQGGLLLQPLLDLLPSRHRHRSDTEPLTHSPAGTRWLGTGADLLLLQGLDEGVLQAVGVLRLQGLLLVGGHALLAEDPPALLLLPVGGEVGPALGAVEGLHAGQRPPQLP